MKILFINQFFWPDSSATSQQLTDMAAGLAARGHDVSVLCSDGSYATAASEHAPARVRILRVKAFRFARGRTGRVLSYLSFYAFACARGLTAKRQQVVVSMTTPPLLSLLGALIKIVCGSEHFIWEQDMYPDVAVDLGYFPARGIADRIVGLLADAARRHADGVIALGECMKARLVARGIPPDHILIAENWANSEAIRPLPPPGNLTQLILLYSGHLGLAHDLDTLCGAIEALQADPRFAFHFVGSANRSVELTTFLTARAIRSVEFRPYVVRDRLSEGLAACDIGLVTQRDACCGSIVPSKIYGVMAAERPVLFIGPRNATPARVIARHQCGWQIDCGDVAGLTHLLRHLIKHPRLIREAGLRARQALLMHYDLPQSIEHMEQLLTLRTRKAADSREDTNIAASPSRVR